MFTLDQLEQARQTIAPFVRRTPLVASPELSESLGCRVSLKLELFQATGSFKPRGTFNQALGLTAGQRTSGVVAFSGGNFARAVGYAGGVLGLDTVVVMPQGAPRSSIEATRRYGATVEITPSVAAMIERTRELETAGRAGLHPFDHPRMVAGNASVGLELHEQAPDASHVFISIGGGGFITGVGSALKLLNPDIRLFGVETHGSATMYTALEAGEVTDYHPTSKASTLNAPFVSNDALDFAKANLEAVILVSDAAALRAVEEFAATAKIVTELAASVTLVAARRMSFAPHDHVVLVICGGNISIDEIAQLRRDLDADQG
jgi:threonine dehydratase